MRLAVARIAAVLVAAFLFPLFAQPVDKPVTAIPRLVRVTGSFHPANGLPIGTTESATLSIYKDEQGGQPLWQETQNAGIDAEGHYTALLGITQQDGVPLDLFSSTEPRWLGVMFNRPGEVEQPRVQLVSVPYALKASDAETLGGRPASAYLLDPNATSNSAASGSTSGTSAGATSLPNPKSLKPRSISGSMNYIPYFTDNSNDLGNSVLYQSGSSSVGIGTTSPSAPLDLEAVIPSAAFIVARYTGSSSQAPTSLPMAVRTARGTYSSPSAVQQGDLLGPYVAQAFDGTGFGSAGQIIYWADQNWTSSQHGTYLTLTTVADGTTSAVERLRINNAGNVGIGTTTPGSTLEVAGDLTVSGTGHALIFPDGTQQSTAGPTGVFGSNSINFFTEGGTGTTCTLGSILLNASTLYTGNYLPADGRLLTISTNTALFSLLGTNYGGNGTSTFALPDLRKAAPNNTQYLICVSGVFP